METGGIEARGGYGDDRDGGDGDEKVIVVARYASYQRVSWQILSLMRCT